MPVLGAIESKRSGGNSYCFGIPAELKEAYGASPKSLNVIFPSADERVVFGSRVDTDPEGNWISDHYVAVIIPEVKDIGVYHVALDEEDVTPMMQKLEFLKAACGDIAFRNLGLRLVAMPHEKRGSVVLKPSGCFEDILVLAKSPDLRAKIAANPNASDPEGKPRERALDTPSGHDHAARVLVMTPPPDGNELVFEALAPCELEEQAGKSYAAIRARALSGPDEGKEFFVWAKPTDARSVSVMACLNVGSRFTAQVVDKKDTGLLVERVAEMTARAGVRA
jgi:hypothetical protein